ncbi:KilA-N domain-containing protein [Acinetobacter baumannii]|nr:KilA-N domain-containing protein [Acinetobacter baumannii]AYY89905.1 KilA-N domain-containing protein [Acinetobacter baumannii]MBF6876951.1 KilA-N domain-containing protein [Acinetobacter baumannii]MBF6907239.1 KilA-N domain-containing protein [Acinetobacter baumannii]MBF6948838.1 KilA-N domain-containing protein [Acinetobacter baumannii]MBH8307783.1 KilA-N domain-containing protein [Acinetobacter baumannii]
MTSLAQNFLNPNNKPLVIGDFTIRQDDEGRYCLNDLHKASGDDKKHFPAYFLRNQQTKDLIAEIELSNVNGSDSERYENLHIAVKVIKGGSDKQGTYVVKELVYAYAMWISPKFHLMVIRAYDSLVMEWLLNGKQTISPEQAGILYNIVHTRAKGNKNLIVQMWSRLKNHFKYSASYRELRAIHFEDAKHYLEVMDLTSKTDRKPEKKAQGSLFNEDHFKLLKDLIDAIISQNYVTSKIYRAIHMLNNEQGCYLAEYAFKTNIAVLKLTRAMGLTGPNNRKIISDDLKTASYTTGNQHYGDRWFHPLVESGRLMGGAGNFR